MTSILTTIALKFLTVDGLCTVAAKVIANLLAWASKKGGKAWDVAKVAITKINLWTSLFLQVYDDEELTQEEEAQIAEAIKNKTDIAKLVDIIKKPIEDQVEEKVSKED